MIVIGLTGSIAMGKSETAKQFSARGIPVFDSDLAVHQLYSRGGAAVPMLAELAPVAIAGGAVDRGKLSRAIREDPGLLKRVEGVVHPLIRKMQSAFLDAAKQDGAAIAVLDIPLLFETNRDQEIDKIVVVSTSPETQRERALKRPGMTQEKLDFILARQMPDHEKRARADYIIDTSKSIGDSQRQVDEIVKQLTGLSGQ